MKVQELILRCYAEKDGETGQWQAFCLDLCLAAQGDTFEDAKAKLEGQIADYVYDAVAGEDRDFAHQLLKRRAPWQAWVRYCYLLVLTRFGRMKRDIARLFSEIMPLTPAPR